MRLRRLCAVSLGVTAATAFGCAVTEAPTNDISSASAGITKSTADVATAEANAVVFITSVPFNPSSPLPVPCTGYLLTPRVVATTQECIQLNQFRSEWRVVFGNDLQDPAAVTMRSTGFPVVDVFGVAYLFLSPPTFGSPDLAYQLTAATALPRSAGTTSPGGPWIAGWGATLPPAAVRSVKDLNGIVSVGSSGTDGPFQLAADPLPVFSTPNWTLQFPGDYGAVLFEERTTQRADGLLLKYRYPLGVAFANWAPITGPLEGHGFLFHKVTDFAVSGTLENRESRTVAWRARHRVLTGYWIGDVDYVGPCSAAFDQDCDHWYDHGPADLVTDNCPYRWNPAQIDSDDDGIGDECELNPCESDIDGDGIPTAGCDKGAPFCASRCPKLPPGPPPSDNCPKVSNAFQENCNADFETAAISRGEGVAALGDACDPVPCPLPEALDDPQGTLCGPVDYPPGCGTNNLGCTEACRTFVFSNQIKTTLIPSHVSAELLGSSVQPVAVNVNVGSTRPRYCQNFTSVATTIDCTDANVLRDAQLGQAPDDDSEVGNDPTQPWHRILFGNSNFLFQRDLGFGPTTYAYNTRTTLWRYDQDINYWLFGPNAPKVLGLERATDPVGKPCDGNDCLNGFFWMNSNSLVGNTQKTVGSVTVGFHGHDLSNGLTKVQPKTELRFCLSKNVFPIQNKNVIGPPGSSGSLSLTPIVWPYAGSKRLVDRLGWTDTQLLLPMGDGSLAAVRPDGSFMATSNPPVGTGGSPIDCGGDHIDPTVLQLASAGTWLSAVEAARTPGAPDAVAIGTGGEFLGTATAIGESFLGTSFDPAAESTLSTPPARAGFVSFYSGTAHAVFLLGGRTSTAEKHDVWVRPLDGVWRDITPAPPAGVPALGDLVTATYSFVDRRLWLVDERKVGPLRVLRLVRVAIGGPFEVVATWPSLGLFDRKLLTLDRDGRPLLTLASSKVPKFVTVAISAKAPRAPAWPRKGSGGHDDDDDEEVGVRVHASFSIPGAKLLAPPVATPRGYLFFVERAGQRSVVHTDELTKRDEAELDESL